MPEKRTEKKQLRTQILKRAFERAQKQNPAFSLRALAQKLGVSPAFVSKLLNGKADLPFDRMVEVVRALKMDKISENRLLKSYADMKTQKILDVSSDLAIRHDEIMSKYVEMADKQYVLLTKWYYIAILDLAGCRGFRAEAAWVAKRLNIVVRDADQALNFLKAQGFLLQNEDGDWIKSTRDTRLPTKESRELIRYYHQMMMKKAAHHMDTATAQTDFDRRLIAGISIAANPANFARAMARLNEAVYEVAHILSAGECTEVYHLGFQLFPVTVTRSGTGER